MALRADSSSCRLLMRVKGVSLNAFAFAVEIYFARCAAACIRFRTPDIVKNSRINRVDKQFDFRFLILDSRKWISVHRLTLHPLQSKIQNPKSKMEMVMQRMKDRRERLMAHIPAGAAIFPAAPTAIRNNDV